jgi:hypothetical protein
MLGAIKGDVEANISLFRRLSRRWRPLVRVKRERSTLASALGVEEAAPRAPTWIGVKRSRSLPKVHIEKPAAKRMPPPGWNPWLWVK